MQGHASLSSDWPGASLPEYVRGLTTVAIAVITRDGILKDANLGFFELLPNSMSAADLLDVRDLFVSPRFDHFVTSRPNRLDGAIYRGIFNLGSFGDTVCSLHGALYALKDTILLVAEQEVAGLELLRAKVLQLNDDLVEEQRKLAAALHEAKRQKAIAEAAALQTSMSSETSPRAPE